ncbi:ethanolamine ammonia-lyase [Thioclava sp. SK-1]|uniref:ethanolamine ammonia-lyase subunit EutC n=1 Tax=Thioclava sp. SK-1 TaxID=1889770 RepID=UPI000824588E|nr:ethanolamine ammonia-lyase subunit EutC [Thioclava sp. SK-1]OCX67255.1 ethanolamine ammonia-lyase [Thioclava sp. SK-1]
MSDVPAYDRWARLRAATPARIGLGRTGAGLPTGADLAFRLAHARARDAVHSALDFDALAADLAPLPVLRVASQAEDRASYLKRPDLGRKLADGTRLEPLAVRPDVVFVVADGLSSDAVAAHAAEVVHASAARLAGRVIGPVVLASQARVAIGDQIGHALGARMVVVLVGERPGLTVADSLGAYITFAPAPGRRDSQRNCISNIHAKGGLSTDQAAHKIAWLVAQALRLELTGTGLKDDAPALASHSAATQLGQ